MKDIVGRRTLHYNSPLVCEEMHLPLRSLHETFAADGFSPFLVEIPQYFNDKSVVAVASCCALDLRLEFMAWQESGNEWVRICSSSSLGKTWKWAEKQSIKFCPIWLSRQGWLLVKRHNSNWTFPNHNDNAKGNKLGAKASLLKSHGAN